VTSTRLLVTTWGANKLLGLDTVGNDTHLVVTTWGANKLMQLDAVGNELRRVQLPDYMESSNAAASPTGTFIVSHENRLQLDRHRVSEVNTSGEVLRQFSGSRSLSFVEEKLVAVDSQGNIFVADAYNCRILLLDAQLKLRRVIIDEHQLKHKEPRGLFYTEQTGQLLVALESRLVAVFDVRR